MRCLTVNLVLRKLVLRLSDMAQELAQEHTDFVVPVVRVAMISQFMTVRQILTDVRVYFLNHHLWPRAH